MAPIRACWSHRLILVAFVALLASPEVRGEDRFKIYVRNLDGTPLSGVTVQAWEQLEPSPVLGRQATANISTTSVALGDNLVFVGASIVHVGTMLADAVSDDKGQIDVTLKTEPDKRTIVFFANRKGDFASAMVPFLVDATEFEIPGTGRVKDEVKTHTLYIAVPKLPAVPAKALPGPAPSAQHASNDAPVPPADGSRSAVVVTEAVLGKSQGS